MGLIRYLVIAGIALLAYTVYKRFIAGPIRERRERAEDERINRLVQDPHCGIYVDSADAVRRKVPGGELFFCSKKCAKAYLPQQG